MSPRAVIARRSVLPAIVLAAGAAIAQANPQPGCSDPFPLSQRSFRVLHDGQGVWKNAFAYVGNIRSRTFGGFDPFTLHVVVGRWYPPFGSARGVLSEADFRKLTATRNVQGFTARVSKGGEALSFRVGTQKPSTLRVVSVATPRSGDARVELRLCR